MDTYSLAFIGIVLWTLRPGSGRAHRDTARIALRNDRPPEPRPARDRSTDR